MRPGPVLLGSTAFVVFAGELVHGRVLHDLFARDLPRLLYDPRQRAVLTRSLFLDFLQHFLWKVETLFPLVRTGHESTPLMVISPLDFSAFRQQSANLSRSGILSLNMPSVAIAR